MRAGFYWLFRAGVAILVLAAAMHLLGHLAGEPPAENESEKALMDLMRNYRKPIMGVSLSTLDIMTGYGLYFSVSLLGVAAFGLVGTSRRRDAATARATVWVSVAFAVAATAISAMHWPLPPTVLLGAAALCFIGAVAMGRPRATSTG